MPAETLTRSYDALLERWHHDKTRRPLLLRGVSRVGKSAAVRRLGKNFEQFVEINLAEKPVVRKLLLSDMPTRDVWEKIASLYHIPSKVRDVLVFFDEVQCVPQVFRRLIYFYEEMPHLHIIASGALVNLALESFPKNASLCLRLMDYQPLAFYEFLRAVGESDLSDAVLEVTPQKPLSETEHKKAMRYFDLYMKVGGLPLVVEAFRDGGLEAAIAAIDRYIAHYHQEVLDNIAGVTSPVLQGIVRDVIFSGVHRFDESTMIARDAAVRNSVLLKMEKAGMLIGVTPTATDSLSLSSQADEHARRLMLFDCGIASRLLGLQGPLLDFDLQFDELAETVMEEIFIATELKKAQDPMVSKGLYCPNDSQVVSFLITRAAHVIPMMVVNATQTAEVLKKYLQRKNLARGFALTRENFSTDGPILNVPIYAVGNINRFSLR